MSVHAITWMKKPTPKKTTWGVISCIQNVHNGQTNLDDTEGIGGCLLLGGNGLENGDTLPLGWGGQRL